MTEETPFRPSEWTIDRTGRSLIWIPFMVAPFNNKYVSPGPRWKEFLERVKKGDINQYLFDRPYMSIESMFFQLTDQYHQFFIDNRCEYQLDHRYLPDLDEPYFCAGFHQDDKDIAALYKLTVDTTCL